MARTRIELLRDGTRYPAATYYEDGQILEGEWMVTLKIDGIRYVRNQLGVPWTRGGKPALPQVEACFPAHMHDCELFRQDWSTSMSLKAATIQPTPDDFYSLNPIDQRLILHPGGVWAPEQVIAWRDYALSLGHEGIVMRQGDKLVKVVPLRAADVRITGWYEGNGRLRGTFGGFTTHYGRVGGGFSDEMRHKIWNIISTQPSQLAGKIIQVVFREKTTKGKFRMPVFDRFRFDKDEEVEYGVHDNWDE
ncbi:hypothetical protein VPHK436_0038 [Vibrio phage K436]